MTRITTAILAGMLAATPARSDPPAELEDCTGPGANFCADSTAALLEEGCGTRFDLYQGRIAWPVLRNVGAVTIAVQTRNIRFGQTAFPLYIEVFSRADPADPGDCRTDLGGFVVLVAQGGTQCGGTWESVGPMSLVPFGIPLGANYSLNCTFFQALPRDSKHSVGFACIRVTSTPDVVMANTWARMKQLYR